MTAQISFKQKTIKKEISLQGIGVHSGLPVKILLKPAKPNSGIIFLSTNSDMEQIKIGSVIPEEAMHATVLRSKNWALSTIEHLLSAISALHIDNITIEVDGAEIPIFDGSALPFIHAFLDVGIEEQLDQKIFLTPKEKIEFKDGEGRFIIINPADDENRYDLLFDYSVDFKHPLAGKGNLKGIFSEKFFIEEISPARTFGFLNQLPYLRHHNLAKGVSLGNTVVIGDDEFINERRFDDEFVRHKFLDLIGDLACLGKNLVGTITAAKTGHSFNRKVVEHFIQNPDLWELF
jgi:UDP-3-O-[3-hydroxymyristoyl] N-acetylglucosamine deacetylase